MQGTPDNTFILHWDECRTSWTELYWRDWVRFRGFGKGGLSLLAGAEVGESKGHLIATEGFEPSGPKLFAGGLIGPMQNRFVA